MIQNRLKNWRRLGSISVIIPVLNESDTISSVVEFALRSPLTGEVIVVDDGSIDGTPELAHAAGARVVTSSMLGKGVSMEDGMREAQFETLVYLDGDLRDLCDDLIERITTPVLNDTADLVKARFTRTAGRVTVLTARPLLRTYFPELTGFDQPLGGIIAARKSLLESLTFENDYGVDVGLLIDAAMTRARVVEVDIGHIEHDSHPLELLENMATQVARSILDRAARHGRLRAAFVQEVQEVERHRRADIPVLFQNIAQGERLALFDMDGTLLNGRFVLELAKRTEKQDELKQYLDHYDITPKERVLRIAALFAGVPRTTFEQVAREIPLMPGAIQAVVGLRKAGYRVGIVTDSYQAAAEIVRRRVFADFSFAHLMRFKRGKATGRLTLCPAMFHDAGCTIHDHCKLNVLHHLSERLEISSDRILAIGDGENDICMLRAAGCSVAFEPKKESVRLAAQHVVDGNLAGVLELKSNALGVPLEASF